jgi:NAD(P)-dependent dehydrogenase (short-subunit alcohol dehydrogenase family)
MKSDATRRKVVLVTGASHRIGEATAALLAKGGFLIFGTSRRPPQLPGDSHALLQLDVTSDRSVEACVAQVIH